MRMQSFISSAYSFSLSSSLRSLTRPEFTPLLSLPFDRNNGAPFIHTTHWKAGAVTWGGELPLRFESKPRKFKLACGSCRSPVGTWNEVSF